MKLAGIFMDGMVIQYGSEHLVWGYAMENETIKVKFQNREYTALADKNGEWSVMLKNIEPGGPYVLEVSGENKIIINDILCGEVFLLAGQSNMELPMIRTIDLSGHELENDNFDMIRQFRTEVDVDFKNERSDTENGKWIKAISHNGLDEMSAAGYFFAKNLYLDKKIPVGLYLTAVGGTKAWSWISKKTLLQNNLYTEEIEKLQDDDYVKNTIKNEEEYFENWYTNLYNCDAGIKERWYEENYCDENWDKFKLPDAEENKKLSGFCGSVWFRRKFHISRLPEGEKSLLYLGAMVDSDEVYINDIKVGSTGYQYPPRRYYFDNSILKNENVIAIRLTCNCGYGRFITGKPYAVYTGSNEIDLSGEWKMKTGAKTTMQQPQTRFVNKPAGLFHYMISPLKNVHFKGVLWYQGESDTDEYEGYENRFSLVVKDFRDKLNNENLPFITVSLADYDDFYKDSNVGLYEIRKRQAAAAEKIENITLVSTEGIGEENDLHPQNKKELGRRMYDAYKKMILHE